MSSLPFYSSLVGACMLIKKCWAANMGAKKFPHALEDTSQLHLNPVEDPGEGPVVGLVWDAD